MENSEINSLLLDYGSNFEKLIESATDSVLKQEIPWCNNGINVSSLEFLAFMRNILKNIFDGYSYEVEDESVVIVLLADVSSSIIKKKDFYNWPYQRINTIFYDFSLMLRKILKSIRACQGYCDMSFVYDNVKHAEKFFDDIPKRRYYSNFLILKKSFYEFTLTLISQKYAYNLDNKFWFVTLDEYTYEGKIDPPKPHFKRNHDYFFCSGDEYSDEDISDEKFNSNDEGQNSTKIGDERKFKNQNTYKMLDTCNQDENRNFKKAVIIKKTQKTILEMLKEKENIDTNQNKKILNDFSSVGLETKIACIETFCNNNPPLNKLVSNNIDTESNTSKINNYNAFSVLMNASKMKFGKKK